MPIKSARKDGNMIDLNEMLEMPRAEESFALIAKLTKKTQRIMDDAYVESIIAQLRSLGSGEAFVEYARGRVSSTRRSLQKDEAKAREAFSAFRELKVENLLANHVLYSGCVEYGYPCLDHNGPCCCEPGCCPFGQEEVRLDENFVEEQLAKLHLNSDITRAKENIRRARAIIQS